jgi:Protein of unknown function (DUF3296).
MHIPTDLPVNRGKYGDLPVKDVILKKTAGLLEHMVSKHGKVLPVRFDVHYPKDVLAPGDNKDISRMITKLRQNYARKGCDPHFIWVREQKDSPNPHYHCTLLMNANKVRSFGHVFDNAERLWGSTIDSISPGLIEHCMGDEGEARPFSNGILIVRADADFEEKYKHVHHQISYLAKASGKAEPKDGLRDFGMSRIPHKRKGKRHEQD